MIWGEQIIASDSVSLTGFEADVGVVGVTLLTTSCWFMFVPGDDGDDLTVMVISFWLYFRQEGVGRGDGGVTVVGTGRWLLFGLDFCFFCCGGL